MLTQLPGKIPTSLYNNLCYENFCVRFPSFKSQTQLQKQPQPQKVNDDLKFIKSKFYLMCPGNVDYNNCFMMDVSATKLSSLMGFKKG